MKIAAKTGIAVVRHSAHEKSEERWQRVSDEMSQMKGLMMKVGQMASYIEGALPTEAQPFLQRLQSQSDPLEFSAVCIALENAFGHPLDELYDSFESSPIAAASIGQVHKAHYNNTPVAVKVQYPQIKTAIANDLSSLRRISQLGLLITPGGGRDILEELKERFLEECDYAREASYLKAFQKITSEIPGAHLPTVVPERSCGTVLTMTFENGIDFETFCSEASPTARNRAATILSTFVWNSVFKHGLFNADPHPGNYLFQRDGTCTFLDFGCVKQFGEERMSQWKSFAQSILENNRIAFEQTSRDMGFVGREKHFDWDGYWDLLRYLYEPFTQPDFVYTSDYVKKAYTMHQKNINLRGNVLPGDMVFTNRLQWGFNSVLAQLGGHADWKSIFHEAVYSRFTPIALPESTQ